MIQVPVHSLTTEQAVQEILATLLRIEAAGGALTGIESRILENTAMLSVLTTNPPRRGAMSVDPIQSVNEALSAQTAAIATLSSELATEHQQWLDAVAAGDAEQAAAVVARVSANTAELNSLSSALAESVPGGVVDGGEVEPVTLPEGIPDGLMPEVDPGA